MKVLSCIKINDHLFRHLINYRTACKKSTNEIDASIFKDEHSKRMEHTLAIACKTSD